MAAWRTYAAAAGVFLLGMAAGLGLNSVMRDRTADAATTITADGDWRLICPPRDQKTGKCVLQQDVVSEAGGAPVVRLTLAPGDKRADAPLLALALPHGVLLQPGIGLGAAEGPLLRRDYSTCDAGGCIVRTTLDGELIKTLGNGPSGRVVFVAGNGREFAASFSLKGFHDATAALNRAQARRTGFWSNLFGG